MTPRRRSRLSTFLRFAAVVGIGVALMASPTSAATPGSIVVLPTTGVVDQVMAGYLSDSIAQAAADGAAAVVIRLDTPGGSLDSTHDIVQTLLGAPLPVVVWVAPSGSRAASAGTFITLAANITAMASGTNIGAATPVASDGSDITGTEGTKTLNDAVASITAEAQARGRPVAWAVSTVENSDSYTVDDAIAAGAIDIKADTIDQLVAAMNGRTVLVNGQSVTLQTTGAAIDEVDMDPVQDLLHLLVDPNIAFILFVIGLTGLILELIHPNFVTGISGAISIVLAFIGFGSLPLNVGGLLLVGIAIVMFVLELTITSHGLLAIGGTIVFVLGASALYTQPGTPTGPSVEVAAPIIIIMTIFTAAFLSLVVYKGLRTRKLDPLVIGGTAGGPQLPLGTVAAVRRALSPTGTVYAVGEEWTARAADSQPIERGTPVRVVGQEGLTLLVEPADGKGSVA